MVYKCFVYGCRTHKYPKNTTFGIPKDPELRMKWAISLRPYSNGKELQSKHRVCKAHFRPEDIECYYNHMIQGTEVKIERGRPELKKGAVPSVFPGQKKPRRILVYKNEEKEKKEQSILLLNGEWVHVKKSEVLGEPTRKRTNKPKVTKPSTSPVKLKNSYLKLKPGNSSDILNEATVTELPLITAEILNDTQIQEPPEPVVSHLGAEILPTPGLSLVKPPDISSICINWSALPLPEEIGSLLCDSVVPSYDLQSPKIRQDLPTEPISQSEKNLPAANNTTQVLSTEEDVISFQQLLRGISGVRVPSLMWGTHTDHIGVYFSCMSYTVGRVTVPKVEKIVMYQGGMRPRIFLREKEVRIPELDRNCLSFEDVEVVLYHIDNLKLCLGIDCTGGITSYSSDCDIFVESGRLPRCPTCRRQRMAEYSKKRYLEPDDSPTRPPKKTLS